MLDTVMSSLNKMYYLIRSYPSLHILWYDHSWNMERRSSGSGVEYSTKLAGIQRKACAYLVHQEQVQWM